MMRSKTAGMEGLVRKELLRYLRCKLEGLGDELILWLRENGKREG